MNKQTFTGKTKEEAINEALTTLNANEDEVVIIDKEVKKTLFNKKVEIEAITKEDINKGIKDYLLFLAKGIGVNAQIETKTRDGMLIFNIISHDNPILIGKNGRTIDAIQNLTRTKVKEELNTLYSFMIDVNDYKQNKSRRLEKLAKYTAKDVARTKIEVKLDPMNSYERRIIHSTLSNSKDVITESTGVEPHRAVVIKPKNKE